MLSELNVCWSKIVIATDKNHRLASLARLVALAYCLLFWVFIAQKLDAFDHLRSIADWFNQPLPVSAQLEAKHGVDCQS